MKANSFLITAIVCILQLKKNTNCLIFHGEVANSSENEYVVQILNDGKRCVGSIISGEHILTAAHCFSHNQNIEYIFINAISPEQTLKIGVKNVTIHPDFNVRYDFVDDIALVRIHVNLLEYRMFRPLLFSTAGPPEIGVMGKISGYGLTENKEVSKQLMTTFVEVIDKNLCNIVLKDRQFCAGDLKGEHDACEGDSGLTFIVNNEAVGVLSIGLDCFGQSTKMKMSRYTLISFYSKWITEKILEQSKDEDENRYNKN